MYVTSLSVATNIIEKTTYIVWLLQLISYGLYSKQKFLQNN